MSRLDDGYPVVAERNLSDGRNLCVVAQTYGNYRILLSEDDTSPDYYDSW